MVAAFDYIRNSQNLVMIIDCGFIGSGVVSQNDSIVTQSHFAVMVEYSSEETSLTLLGRLDAADERAWSVFTRLYGPLVLSWCRNSGRQHEDAADVGQDVFRVVSQKLKQFNSEYKSSGAFRSWLWGITRFEVLRFLRAHRKQPVSKGGTDFNLSLQRLEQQVAEPESVHSQTSRQILLQSAIEILRNEFEPRTWQAFWDMAVKGRSAKDIGDELNMAPKAVRQAKFRVTKKLRELLDADLAEFLGSSVET